MRICYKSVYFVTGKENADTVLHENAQKFTKKKKATEKTAFAFHLRLTQSDGVLTLSAGVCRPVWPFLLTTVGRLVQGSLAFVSMKETTPNGKSAKATTEKGKPLRKKMPKRGLQKKMC